MVDAIREYPETLTNELFSYRLINSKIMHSAVFTSFTPSQKGSLLVEGVCGEILASKNREKDFKKLCQVFSKHASTKELSSRMMEKYSTLNAMLALCMEYNVYLLCVSMLDSFSCIATCTNHGGHTLLLPGLPAVYKLLGVLLGLKNEVSWSSLSS